jgi:rsbT co-antagonist protein RsbR
MGTSNKSRIPEILQKHERELLDDWIQEQITSTSRQRQLMKEPELRDQCGRFLGLLRQTTQENEIQEVSGPEWQPMRKLLDGISQSRGLQGFSTSETARFIFSLKKPLFARLRKEINDPAELGEEIWVASELLDKLGLYTSEIHERTREEMIARQHQDMIELSTPVVKLWEGILALPLIGTLDSNRTQVVMESLLQKIVETGSSVAIIDITGVPTVDTLVAQHLLKTVTAARLMGAECIISGIRPQIAQTIVHLGIALGSVMTKASLADAFRAALQRTNQTLAQLPTMQPERIS